MESEDEEMIELKGKKNSNVVSLTHTVETGVGVMFFCNNWSSFPLPPPPPQTQTHEYTGQLIAVVIDENDEEVTKSSTAAKTSASSKSSAAIKSYVGMDERKLATKPSTTSVAID